MYYQTYLGTDDYPVVYVFEDVSKVKEKCHIEIAEVAWFPADNLPEDVSKATARRLGEWQAQNGTALNW